MLTRQSRLLLGLTVATPLLFAACTDNSIFNPMANAAGTYQLTVYAGRSVPATYQIQAGDPQWPQYPNGATFVVTSGDLILNNNGTFIETNNYAITPTGQGQVTDNFVSSGTWTLNGTDLTLSAPVQNNNSARFVTGTLTPGSNGDTINYQEDTGSGLQAYEYKK
jgi:hypothetical protein